VTALPPARRRALEALGRRMTAQQLRRLEPARRHPLMLVLLNALAIERGDELLDQFDKLLRLTDGRARRRVVRRGPGRVPGRGRARVRRAREGLGRDLHRAALRARAPAARAGLVLIGAPRSLRGDPGCAARGLYEGAGHLVHWEQPERVARGIAAFARSTW